MAKYKHRTTGNFNRVCSFLINEILSTSSSASLEDSEYMTRNNTNIAILVFERYSYSGGNRLSLNVTIVEDNGYIDIIGISSGGSNGVFFKFNTMGEEFFLDKLRDAINKYEAQK